MTMREYFDRISVCTAIEYSGYQCAGMFKGDAIKKYQRYIKFVAKHLPEADKDRMAGTLIHSDLRPFKDIKEYYGLSWNDLRKVIALVGSERYHSNHKGE